MASAPFLAGGPEIKRRGGEKGERRGERRKYATSENVRKCCMGAFAIAKNESSAEDQSRRESRSKGKTAMRYLQENEIFDWIRDECVERREKQQSVGESWPRRKLRAK